MAIAIALSFPSGKFHATPWGRHVNEGVPEWPPSPWRFMRALVATWKRKLATDPQVTQHMSDLLTQLAPPPIFKLPPASLSHTRHYMPWYKGKPKGDKYASDNRTMVFDTFVAVDQAELGMSWPDATLTPSQEDALAKLLANLGYFGRAEAWCIARVCRDWASLSGHTCGWLDVTTGEQSANLNREDTDSVRLLCADSNTINETWHDWNYGEKVDKPDPPWNLMAETKQLHDVGWSDPPGSRWVTYFRPRKALISQHRSARLPDSVWLSQWQLKQGQPCVARYLIDGAVRPLVQDTVYFAEIVRRYVQGIYGKQNHGASSPSFSGKQADGTPSAGHSHAFYLPLDEDGDGKLDHMLIIMPSGISDAELRALNNLSQVRGPSNTTVTLSLTTIQSLEYEQMTRRSKKWRSITPFIATRHYKERGVNKDKGKFLFEQLPEVNLREELVNCGLPVPARVTPIEAHRLSGIERDLPWREFRQQRVFAQYRRGSHFGRGFEIEFLEPVPGPISVGYACHFGLGMFMPVDE